MSISRLLVIVAIVVLLVVGYVLVYSGKVCDLKVQGPQGGNLGALSPGLERLGSPYPRFLFLAKVICSSLTNVWVILKKTYS
jgi:hypothetical protein